MGKTSLFALLLLVMVSFGITGGCNKNNGNGNNPDPGSTDGFDLELAIELGELALVAYELMNREFSVLTEGREQLQCLHHTTWRK